VDALTFQDVFRLAGKHGLLTLDEIERWFVYLDNRNTTAHDYGEGFANETLKILPDYIRDVRTLGAAMQGLFKEESAENLGFDDATSHEPD